MITAYQHDEQLSASVVPTRPVAQESATLPLVSIVTPAYNEEKNLAECIESVISQTYPNWEYTIVNNCSTDRTLEIASDYSKKDPRIRVLTNSEFLPMLANLNNAFRQISPRSKYCKMVLADDWIFSECLARMVSVMEQHARVGIVGAYGLHGRRVEWGGLPYSSTVVEGKQMCRDRLLGGPYIFGTPTSLMFKSDLVRDRNPFYDETNVHSDSETCFDLLKSCDFGFVHQVLTFSRERSGSHLDMSREINTMAAGILREWTRYGSYYLAPDEYARGLKAVIDRYYEFLAKAVFRRQSRQFWQYHKGKLHENGVQFSVIRLGQALAAVVINSTLGRFRSSLRSKEWGL